MKYLLISLSFLFATTSFCQNSILTGVKNRSGSTADKSRTYVDANLKPTTKSRATYYLVKELEEIKTFTNLIPIDNGLFAPHIMPIGYSSYIFNYYHLNDKLSFSASANVMDKNKNIYEFNGPAKWYNTDGSLLAESTLSKGDLNGIYTEYDRNGRVKEQKRYLKGKVFKGNIYQPLLGEWIMLTNNEVRPKRRVYNIFKEDNTLIITTFHVDRNGRQYAKPTNVGKYIWTYIPNKYGIGTLEIYYDDGRFLASSKLEVKGRKITSSVFKHQHTESVGDRYVFESVR